MTIRMVTVVLFALYFLPIAPSNAQDSTPAEATLQRIMATAYEFDEGGKVSEAIAEMERAESFAIAKKLDQSLPGILVFLTTRCIRADRLEAARKSASRMKDIDSSSLGDDHWRTRAWTATLQYIGELEQLDEVTRKQVLIADAELANVDSLVGMGRAEEAISLARGAYEVFRKHLGDESTESADASGKLGTALHAVGRSAEAEPFLRRALKRYPEIYGDGHPSVPGFATALGQAIGLRAQAAEQGGNMAYALTLRREVVDALSPVFPDWDDSPLIESRYQWLRVQREVEPLPPTAMIVAFADSFGNEASKDYVATPEVRFENAQLSLNQGSIQRNVALGPVAELRMDLEIANDSPVGTGFIRWGFLLGPDIIGSVMVTKLQQAGVTRSRLSVMQRVRNDKGEWKEYLVRELPLPTDVDHGSWTIRYSHGLIEVIHDKIHLGFAEIQNAEDEAVGLVVIESSGLHGKIDNLQVSGELAKAWSRDEWALDNFCRAIDRVTTTALNEGRIKDAIEFQNRAIRYRAAIFGNQSIEFARSANYLALCLSQAGQGRNAKDWYQKSLTICEPLFGDTHPLTATVLSNFGAELRLSGKATEAIPYLQRSLRSYEAIAGNDDLTTVNVAAHLSTAYEDTGELALAESFGKLALRVRMQVLGEKNYETFASHTLLARFYLRRHDAASAETLVMKAMEIIKSLYPEDHPNRAQADNLLAFYYFELADFAKATEAALRAFELARKTLGSEHSIVREAGDLLDKIYEQGPVFPTNKAELAQTITRCQTLLAHRRLYLGDGHWLSKKTETHLRTLEKLSELSEESYAEFSQAIQIDKSQQFATAGKLDLAIAEREKSLATVEKLIGKTDIVCVELLKDIARIQTHANLIREPAIKLGEALNVLGTLGMADEPVYAECFKDLASLYGKGELVDDVQSMLESSERILTDKVTDRDTYLAQIQGVLDVYNQLSGSAAGKSNYDKAAEFQNKELMIASRLYGDESWQTRAVRWRMQRFDMLKNLSPKDHEELKKTSELDAQSASAEESNDWNRVIELQSEEIKIRERILGEHDEATTRSRTSLANALFQEKRFLEAISQLEIAVAARIENYGADFPDLAMSYSSLARAYQQVGNFPLALRYGRLAVAIWKQTGEEGIDYATSLNNLAALYLQTNDDASAAPLFRETASVLRQTSGVDSGLYAMCISNLSTAYDSMNDPRADETFAEAVELVRKAYGEQHPEFAMMQSKDASRMQRSGNLEKAEELFQSAINTYQRVMGDDYIQTLINRGNLAIVQLSLGKTQLATTTLRELTQRIRRVYGEDHPSYVKYRMELARCLEIAGEIDEAIELATEALDISRSKLDATAGEQSERQQMLFYASLLNRLERLLSLTYGRPEKTESVYNYLITWKGANFIRQRQRRLLADDPKLQPIVEQLRSISSKLATLNYVHADQETEVIRQTKRTQLLSEQEVLETMLSRLAKEQNTGIIGEAVDALSLQRNLPKGTALVDFFVYFDDSIATAADNARKSERRVVAFITRPDHPLKRIELGSASELEEAIHHWRRMIVMGGGDLRGVSRDQTDVATPQNGELPQMILRDKLWSPLVPELDGCDVVLLAPDGVLNLVPFAALPSSDGTDYLIAERKIAIIPVPQLIPTMFDPRKNASPGKAMILMIGDIDFGADPGANTLASTSLPGRMPESNATRSSSSHFANLPGTAMEIDLIAKQFAKSAGHEKVEKLEHRDATEEAIRRLAPKSRYLHFATHGFFNDPRDHDPGDEHRSGDVAWADDSRGVAEQVLSPALFSGLAVAGANRGQTLAISGEITTDDGIFTAAEVAELDLQSLSLVVLSACETGLGRVTAGEGIMGLQRSFQVAGAKTVISSLWQVDDAATQALMVEFYKNLLSKKLDKLEALRQAQLSLLHGELYRPASIKKDASLKDEGIALPPRYWAAFLLYGDWR